MSDFFNNPSKLFTTDFGSALPSWALAPAAGVTVLGGLGIGAFMSGRQGSCAEYLEKTVFRHL